MPTFATGPHSHRWPHTSFIASLPRTTAEALLSIGRPETIDAGRVLIEQGAHGRDVFLILKGLAKVVVTGSGKPRLLAVRGRGGLVGEFAYVDQQPRSATVTAGLATLRVQRIDPCSFQQWTAADQAAACAVVKLVVSKARAATLQRAEDARGDPVRILVRFFVALSELQTRTPTLAGSVTLEVQLTQGELSQLANISEHPLRDALNSEKFTEYIARVGTRIRIRDIAQARRFVAGVQPDGPGLMARRS